MMSGFGFDWPYAVHWLVVPLFLFIFVLGWHGKRLLRTLSRRQAWMMIVCRGLVATLLLLLVLRPHIVQNDPDPSSVRVLSLVDLSGSMNTRDRASGETRLDLVRPHLLRGESGSWVQSLRSTYGHVESRGFASENWPIGSGPLAVTEDFAQTALGDTLSRLLEEENELPLSSVVLFSDGRNNLGTSPVKVAQAYRDQGIPVNVIGVGELRETGNLSVSFVDPPTSVTAKEEFVLNARVVSAFAEEVTCKVELWSNEQLVDEQNMTLLSGEGRTIEFQPQLVGVAGIQNYQVLVSQLDGDVDPSDNNDFLSLPVRPPNFFSVLHLSNHLSPLYPFIKRSLAIERYQLSSQIKLSEGVFHTVGENFSVDGFSDDPEFWMQFDVVVLDLSCLAELNATLVSSLKDYVQKRGGGLLSYGSLKDGRASLGGLLPAIAGDDLRSKQDLSLEVLSDPLFLEQKKIEQWQNFLPHSIPSVLVTRVNPAARRSVNLRGNPEKSVLVVQAYGAGKSAYWGSPGDWRRALRNPESKREFTLFWQGVVEWLGAGAVERLKVENFDNEIFRGSEVLLQVEALGGNFEPSLDAMIEANVSGPNDYSLFLNLYPQGGEAGAYSGKFKTAQAGSYRVEYKLKFPDGETMEHTSHFRVKDSSEEARDVRYNRRDLQMIATMTGGKFTEINRFDRSWMPNLSEDLPTVSRRSDLADIWPLFVLLFLLAGLEWIWRRKEGLR
jgi:hypothetical protein